MGQPTSRGPSGTRRTSSSRPVSQLHPLTRHNGMARYPSTRRESKFVPTTDARKAWGIGGQRCRHGPPSAYPTRGHAMVALVVTLVSFAALGAAAVRWGADTRDGRDWQPLVGPWWSGGLMNDGDRRSSDEDVLHWSGSGMHAQLHGRLLPLVDGPGDGVARPARPTTTPIGEERDGRLAGGRSSGRTPRRLPGSRGEQR